jgi:hypothetical protein
MILSVTAVISSAAEKSGTVGVSFGYERQTGNATNQYALWVEDSDGRLVKTLYATRFTVAGGWEKRPNSIKLWVKQSNLPEMTTAQTDAITSPTPRSGVQKYSWDFTDNDGKPVPDGAYTLFLEGTLRDEDTVVYSARFETGASERDLDVETKYSGDDLPDRGMIHDVKIHFVPR